MLTSEEQMSIIKDALAQGYRGPMFKLFEQAAAEKAQAQQQQPQQAEKGGLVQSYQSTPPSMLNLPTGNKVGKAATLENAGMYKTGGEKETESIPPELHTTAQDNTRVDIPIKKDEALPDWITNNIFSRLETPEQKDQFVNYWKEIGKPNVSFYDDSTAGKIAANTFAKGRYAFYNPIDSTIYIDPKYRDNSKAYTNIIIDELPHARQHSDQGLVGFTGHMLKDIFKQANKPKNFKEAPKATNLWNVPKYWKNVFNPKVQGQTYQEEGTFEHDAHHGHHADELDTILRQKKGGFKNKYKFKTGGEKPDRDYSIWDIGKGLWSRRGQIWDVAKDLDWKEASKEYVRETIDPRRWFDGKSASRAWKNELIPLNARMFIEDAQDQLLYNYKYSPLTYLPDKVQRFLGKETEWKAKDLSRGELEQLKKIVAERQSKNKISYSDYAEHGNVRTSTLKEKLTDDTNVLQTSLGQATINEDDKSYTVTDRFNFNDNLEREKNVKDQVIYYGDSPDDAYNYLRWHIAPKYLSGEGEGAKVNFKIPKKTKKGGIRRYKKGGKEITSGGEYMTKEGKEKFEASEKFQKQKDLHIKGLDFYKQWVDSPMYNKMVQKEDPKHHKYLTKHRKKNLEGIKTAIHEEPNIRNAGLAGRSFTSTGNIEYFPSADVGTYVHEISHSSDRPAPHTFNTPRQAIQRGESALNFLTQYTNPTTNIAFHKAKDALGFKSPSEYIPKKGQDVYGGRRLIPSSTIDQLSSYAEQGPSMEYIRSKSKDGIMNSGDEHLKQEKDWHDYVAEPTETRARVMAIRQGAHGANIYNPLNEEMSEEQFNNLLEKQSELFPVKGLNPIKQLNEIYGPEKTRELINTMSFNVGDDLSGDQYAKKGGMYKKKSTLINRKVLYNKANSKNFKRRKRNK